MMLENFNDILSFLFIVILVGYIVYRVIRAFSYARLARHIRDEQKHYKQWLDNEEQRKNELIRPGGK